LAKIEGKVAILPTPKPAKVLPVKNIIFLILKDECNQVFLEKRPATGIWGGLWSLPEFESIEAIEVFCEQWNVKVNSVLQLDQQRHTFSHYHLDYTPVEVKIDNPINNVMEANQSVWYKTEQVNLLGLATPIKRLLQYQ